MADAMTAPSVHIRDIADVVPICESHLRGACVLGNRCDYHHYTLPYLWQVHVPDRGWLSIVDQSQDIEKTYCDLKPSHQQQMPVTLADGSTSTMLNVEINFNELRARLTSQYLPPSGVITPVRRLTTDSYAQTVEKYGNDAGDVKYHTQWRWYWWADSWKPFNQDKVTPQQYILETKYLSRQDIYRFVIQNGGQSASAKQGSTEQVFLLNFVHLKLTCLNDKMSWTVIRRPLYTGQTDIIQQKYLESPPIQLCPFLPTLPDNWHPIDTQHQYEMIPLNPDSMGYHLVASEFHSSLPLDRRKILDIFRIQNPFLWNQYALKKKLMEKRLPKTDPELQLFHGTSDDSVIQAICRDNFDWRVCGKNNTVYGKGSYFARNAAYSDKYARSGAFVKWMFMARVLVGRYTKGNSSMVRPPPLDAAFPHGELHESCVDKEVNPMIFVIFEKDQCYPEYLISYQG